MNDVLLFKQAIHLRRWPKHLAQILGHQVSISPIFYKQRFHKKVFCAAFMCLQFGFVIFWQKDFGAKAAHKMLVKLTPGFRSWCLSFKMKTLKTFEVS
jgi:hypothetical protein